MEENARLSDRMMRHFDALAGRAPFCPRGAELALSESGVLRPKNPRLRK